ncbi:MAG: glycyl-radical enzyme activating protein [Clostridiaceae bacterium]
MDGIITDIQRFSLNDGPGIRTTVFFKGCSMRCAWCHNPETLSPVKDLHYYERNCIGCGKCAEVCGTGAHYFSGGKHIFDRSLCLNCGKCANACYPDALVISGRKMSVKDVMEEILQDKAYYLDSGGGVTLSGGEVLCQQEFAAELVYACHENGIEVGVETNLYKPFNEIEQFLGMVDLVMLDIKLFDNEQHKKWTGVENSMILENVKKLSELGKPIIVRTPLIIGVTDTDENLKYIAMFIQGIKGVLRYELLNFNPLGTSKYASLGKENMFGKTRPLPQKRLDEIIAMLSEYSVAVKVV